MPQLAKRVLAKLGQQQKGTLPLDPTPSSLHEGEVDPAKLEAEEVHFRLWWRTLPDKISARKRWVDIARYYGRAKGLSNAFTNSLLVKVQDLAQEGMKRQPERRRR